MTRSEDTSAEFLLALGFLTRLPIPDPGYTPERMAVSIRWYPAVGAIIGFATGLVFLLAALMLPTQIAVLLSVAAGLLLTGALHEDGLADCCDGLGGGQTRERTLEIMRDSRIGTYGVLGLGVVLATKVTALAHLPYAVFWALIAGHALSRAMMVLIITTSDYAREAGAAKDVAGGLDRLGTHIAVAIVAAALIPLMIALPISSVLFGLIGLALGYSLMRRAYEARLGGYTGDCLGAVQQISELGFYVGLLVWL